MPDDGQELYDSLGGAAVVAAVVERLYARMLADPKIAAYFSHVPLEQLTRHQTAFLAHAFGGPAAYSGRALQQAHALYQLTNADFERMAQHLAEALNESGVAAGLVDTLISRIDRFRQDIVSAPSFAREQ